MFTTLNVKVGSKITFKLLVGVQENGTEDYRELDGEIVDFPKTVRVKTKDGQMFVINADQIVAQDAKQPPARFGSRFQPRM
jgi:hypothetical protein